MGRSARYMNEGPNHRNMWMFGCWVPRAAKLRLHLAAGLACVGLHGSASAAVSLTLVCNGADPKAQAERGVASTESGAQFAFDVKTAEAAIVRVDDLRRRLSAGESLEAPYTNAANFASLSVTTKDPVDAELFRRAALDQFARDHATAAVTRTSWAAGLDEGALQIAFTVVSSNDLCGIDADNTRWLQAQLRSHGWFKRSTDGSAADQAAFLIVQHADRDKAFQKQVLQTLEPLLASQETRPANYALLYDRVAAAEDRPQRYGTQGRCSGRGTWTERPVEDAASLDERRAAVGLEPMADYKGRIGRLCP